MTPIGVRPFGIQPGPFPDCETDFVKKKNQISYLTSRNKPFLHYGERGRKEAAGQNHTVTELPLARLLRRFSPIVPWHDVIRGLRASS